MSLTTKIGLIFNGVFGLCMVYELIIAIKYIINEPSNGAYLAACLFLTLILQCINLTFQEFEIARLKKDLSEK